MNTDELLKERDKTHGNWDKQSTVAAAIKRLVIHPGIVDSQAEALSHIAVKLSRITTGDPDFRDHWDDIAGYAKLASDRCTK